MKKIYCLDHNSILKDIKKEFEVVNNIEDADVVILWNDVNPVERGIINLAHLLGKKVIVIQHGRKGTSKYYPPFNEKIQADKLLVWGEFDRRSLLFAGQDKKKIKVVGTTIFSHLKERQKHEGINLVFCPEHWDKPIEENEKVKKELRKLEGINIITKIIDSPSHDGIKWDNSICSNRNSNDHLSICIDTLSTTDIVVGISESTFELLAQAMDIPVVIMEDWEPKAFGGDMGYINYRRVISRAVKKANINNLLEIIRDQLKNPDELKEERKQVCIEEGGINLNSLELIKYEIQRC